MAASVEYIRRRVLQMPKIGVVLGSGLGDFGNLLTKATSLQTKDIPHYPISSVVGHAGKILFGRIKEGNKESKELIVFQGRIHFYESDDTSIVVYPIEVAHRLGITKLIVTNAAGGVNRKLSPGDLMFITDYINFSFENPLIGRKSTDVLQTHPVFDPKFLSTAKTVALHNNIPFKEGVYCWTKGPSYESAAEITMMGKAGADAVGMSTVPEAILAASYGMEVLGISCVTNLATGLTGEKLAHAEVTEVANTVKHHFTDLVSKIILQL
ncbi:MAG TPA: purine-nucleoside phosphorylase [Bacteroidota bacterium]|nr:purine-nucleoside phosphorylase [Bacteroidota bacterium]